MNYQELNQEEKAFLKKIMNAPLLSQEEEVSLIQNWQQKNDEKALQKLIICYSRLGIKIAYDFKGYGLSLVDLIQEAQIGLIDAANRFDISKDVRFSTYAMWWVKAAIQDFIIKNSSIVRIATTAAQKTLFFNFKRLRRDYLEKNGAKILNDHDFKSLSKKLNVPAESIRRLEVNLHYADRQLNASPHYDSNTEYQDILIAEDPNPEEQVFSHNSETLKKQWVSWALDHLTPREREIIENRFMGETKLTLSEIGTLFGVTKERIRQIENKALQKLKKALSSTLKNPLELLEA